MHTTAEFLDWVRDAYDLASDYQVAALLGLKRQQISTYRTGKHTLGDDLAIKVAELLKISPAYVLACMAAERARGKDAKREWSRLAKKLAPAALAILAAVTLAPAAFDITPSFAHSLDGGNIHYAHWLCGLFLAAVLAWKRPICSARWR